MTRRSLLPHSCCSAWHAARRVGRCRRTAGAAVDREVTQDQDLPRHGIEISRLSGDERKLAGTPRSFRRSSGPGSTCSSTTTDSKPRCATAPIVVVDRYHGAGLAAPVRVGTARARLAATPSSTTRPSQAGARSSAPRKHGSARTSRGTACPRSSAAGRASTRTSSRSATTAGRPTPSAPRPPLAVSSRSRAATRSCPRPMTSAPPRQTTDGTRRAQGLPRPSTTASTAGDSGPLAVQLGDAPYGCAITATYRKNRTSPIMLPDADATISWSPAPPFA